MITAGRFAGAAATARALSPADLDKLAAQGKLPARRRMDLLLDGGSFVEDGLLANAHVEPLPVDGVVTRRGTVDGRSVLVVANDPTVKAGSWGARTVAKIVRVTEAALELELPVFRLVDSAGARITDQVELFPGGRGAGKIFYNQVRSSGRVPQICCLFGPSAASGAYVPAFCDIVITVEGNASMYLGSPRTFLEIKPLFAPELVVGFGVPTPALTCRSTSGQCRSLPVSSGPRASRVSGASRALRRPTRPVLPIPAAQLCLLWAKAPRGHSLWRIGRAALSGLSGPRCDREAARRALVPCGDRARVG